MRKLFCVAEDWTVGFDQVDPDTLSDPAAEFHRSIAVVAAGQGVSKQDILNEVQEIAEKIERIKLDTDPYEAPVLPRLILTTTLRDCGDCVVALGYSGFIRLADGLKGKLITRERYDRIAEQLIRNRKP